MKQKILLVMCTIMTCLLAQHSSAQTRYQDSIFANYTLTTVLYSVYGDSMDIYQPAGDVQATRPVVVLAHEGTFYTGTRNDDPTVVSLCQDLAHKGYIVVSIDYRLVSNPTLLLDTLNAAVEVFKSIGDAKAAVRYLYQDAYGANNYKVDTANIFIGGNSAGAVLAMHYAYVDSIAQLAGNPYFIKAVDSIGGTLQGNSGNPGYSSNVKGVISLAGGLNQVSWMGYCSKPVVSAQGSDDQIVPFTCAEPFVFGIAHVPLVLCGLGSLAPNMFANTPFADSIVFYGQQHVPWDTSAGMFYSVDTLVTGFLYKEVTNAVPTACSTTGINNVANTVAIKLYPNPASNQLNIQSSQFISDISITDETGRTVITTGDIHDLSYQLNTSRLSSGIYFVSIYCGETTPVIKKVTIE
jgi:para-nitrobenzyl esterase